MIQSEQQRNKNIRAIALDLSYQRQAIRQAMPIEYSDYATPPASSKYAHGTLPRLARVLDGGEGYFWGDQTVTAGPAQPSDYINGPRLIPAYSIFGTNYRKTAGGFWSDSQSWMPAEMTSNYWSGNIQLAFSNFLDLWTTHNGGRGGFNEWTQTCANVIAAGCPVSFLYTEVQGTFLVPPGQFSIPVDNPAIPGCTQAMIDATAAIKTAQPGGIIFYWSFYVDGPSILSPQWLRNNLSFVQNLPFDGFNIMIKGLNDRYYDLTSLTYHKFLSSKPGTLAEWRAAVAPMAGLNLGDQMFLAGAYCMQLGGNVGNGMTQIDPFDSTWDTVVLPTVANAAQACAEVGIRGFMIDDEDYGSNWAQYEHQLYTGTYSLAQYQKQMYVRGKQFVKTILSKMPSALIWFMSNMASAPTLGTTTILMGAFRAGCLAGLML